MPKNKVIDPITDQEIAFARLVLSGTMTDRHAAEAVGLNPDSAAYTKSKPRVRDYMLQHRAAVQQQLVQQEADGLHRLHLDREQVLNRLWEIANMSPEMTRNSITGQVKCLSMIVAMENFIPDPRAVPSAEKKPAPAPAPGQIYQAAWLRRQQATTPAPTNDPQPSPAPDQQEEDSPAVPAGPASPASPGVPRSMPWKPALGSAEVFPDPGPSRSTFANPPSPSEAPPPYVPGFASASDIRVPFSIKKPPFARPR
jgi:hypothetical protein